MHSPRAIRLKAHSFPKDYMICRLCYINHPPVAGATADAMQQKFAKEEANSVHITYPKFTAVFIPGLILSPISWIVQKGKGRLIVDKACQGGHRTSQCARTTPGGGLFLRRHLSAVWNMRIAHPREDLRSGCIVSSGRRQYTAGWTPLLQPSPSFRGVVVFFISLPVSYPPLPAG